MSNYFFRTAVTRDAFAIARLVNSAYRGEASRAGWTTEADLLDGARTDLAEIESRIAEEGSMFLLCLDGEQLIGSVHLERHGNDAHLGMFSVAPAAQARGIGKALMAAAETAVPQTWGSQRVVMHVISVRAELIAFYERRGYRLTGETVAFPINPALWTAKVDALVLAVMEKHLAAPHV